MRQRPREPQPRRLRLALAALGVVLVVAVALVVLGPQSSPPVAAYRCADIVLPSASAAAEVMPTLGRAHVSPDTSVVYDFCPPTSGPHFDVPPVSALAPRLYGPTESVSPGSWVHNLEHGFVVALYRCTLGTCPAAPDMAALTSFVGTEANAVGCRDEPKLLAARFDQIATPFALLAWDRALLVDQFDPANARSFAEQFVDQTAPETNCGA